MKRENVILLIATPHTHNPYVNVIFETHLEMLQGTSKMDFYQNIGGMVTMGFYYIYKYR